MRVGVIRHAEPIPKAKNCFVCKSISGLSKERLFPGLEKAISPEELIGKQIIVVANLQPATLMGVQSEGMLLAAKYGGGFELIHVEKSPPGSEVS